ncbi:MAG: ABC transporter substrate-binding protein [Ruminococcaceae bacterium]|nr:ABC transporter substrate-binding protein [Oscillospiraceae bacterium]
MKKVISLVLATLLALSVTACSGGASESSADKSSESAPASQAAESTASAASTEGTSEIPKGDWVIGLSNSYYGNTWRKQMVDSFESVAKQAKDAGYIADYEIQNGDGTVNAQIAQINSFILKGVDAICINAASSTALNSVIDKATKAGIKVIAFDSIVTNESAYTMDYDFVQYGEECGTYIAGKIGGKGNIVMVRGVSGSAPDQKMYEGFMNVVKKNPGLKIAATVVGEASATKAQEEFAKILPSLDSVDATFNQGGDSYGIAQAFEQAGRKAPIIVGDNSAEFNSWWRAERDKNGYDTIGMRAAPSCGSAAFWAAVDILNGVDVPKKMMLKLVTLHNDDLDQYKNMKPGTIVAPDFTNEFVLKEIIEPARAKQ